MLEFFEGLVNPDADKPFECVGTRSEINAALTLAVKKYEPELPLILQKYKEEYYNEDFDFTEVDNFYDIKNNVPTEFTYIQKIADFFKDKSVAILGFGREGRSTLEFLNKYTVPKNVTVIDKNTQDISGIYGENYLSGLEKYDIIMKAPGIALLDIVSEEVKQKTTSQTDLFLRFAPCRVIGITGTKGKSTTSTATFYALEKLGFPVRLVGNIGVPVFSDLENINEKTVVVYELSCHQLEFVKASPTTAVLLNIFSDHLDHYVSQQAYEDAKRNIYRFQNKNDILISYEKTDTASKQIFIKDIINIETVKTKLIGQHNKYNLAVAAAAANTVGADIKKALKILEDFNGLEHRIEFVENINGVSYYNDSISTIPEATLGAIDGLKNVRTLILGGFDRGISYDDFAHKLANSEVENIICAYSSGLRIYNLINEIDHKPKLYEVENLEKAVNLAKQITKDGSCLLSPAAASYGDFENFEHRGRVFKQLVKANN
ncbi:MAG: UDP-N-acetylmuramoyl-L-alanine--D-glutamate ligase [Clostridiales bacterium]|nr:MAG: UDP-N-acetylmuramoyl-L-alanine--D-glutamate ligase [Clostridiales bacterium]